MFNSLLLQDCLDREEEGIPFLLTHLLRNTETDFGSLSKHLLVRLIQGWVGREHHWMALCTRCGLLDDASITEGSKLSEHTAEKGLGTKPFCCMFLTFVAQRLGS